LPTPLNDVNVAHAAAVLAGAGAPPAAPLMTQEDSYYFSNQTGQV